MDDEIYDDDRDKLTSEWGGECTLSHKHAEILTRIYLSQTHHTSAAHTIRRGHL